MIAERSPDPSSRCLSRDRGTARSSSSSRDGTVHRLRPRPRALRARLDVHDPALWRALLRGSLGLGRRLRRRRVGRRDDLVALDPDRGAQRQPVRRAAPALPPAAHAVQRARAAGRAQHAAVAAAATSPPTTTWATTSSRLFLDETHDLLLARSSSARTTTLHEAQLAKLDRICREAPAAPGRPPARDRHGLGRRSPYTPRATTAAASPPRRSRAEQHAVAASAFATPGSRTASGAARGLPRPHRHLRQARLDRDDRGRRLAATSAPSSRPARSCSSPTG